MLGGRSAGGMGRALLLCLAFAGLSCGSGIPPAPEDASGPLCGGSRDEGRERLPGARPEVTAREGAPPTLLSMNLTLGGQPIKHMLPAEQGVMTPVPIYIEPPPAFVFKEARLYFRPFGAINYKRMAMAKRGSGLAAEVPCEALTTVADLTYYILMVDEEGQTIDSVGSRAAPLRVAIKYQLEGGFPSVPGMKPPRPCAGADDAPR